MDILSSIAVITLAALVHSSFQLSVSVLTMLSSHALGAKKSQSKLLRLTTSFLLGAVIMTVLLLADVAFTIFSISEGETTQMVWTIACGLTAGVAIAIWLFYYQREVGTSLWIPRSVAKYLTERTGATKSGAEAFGLGLSSVFGELLFIIAPICMSAVVISGLPGIWKLVGLAIYAIISLSSLIFVWVLICSGHSLSGIQSWREKNKHFLQFSAGAGLIAITFFVFVNEVMTVTVAGM